MNVQGFFDGLNHFAQADDMKGAHDELLNPSRPARSKEIALGSLAEAISMLASADERLTFGDEILRFILASTLIQWSRALGGSARTRSEATEEVLRAYFPEEVAEWEEEEEESDALPTIAAYEEDDFTFDPQKAQQKAHDYQRDAIDTLAGRARPGAPKKLLIQIATGGGKTRVANDWIWRHVLPEGKRVLWVTLRWELLRQAAGDLCRRYEGAAGHLGWLSPTDRPKRIEVNPDAEVVYATIHTWAARYRQKLRKQHFHYVVIDEVHWGEGKYLYQQLDEKYVGKAVFVCMTATPRRWSLPEYERVCMHDFKDLVERRILARPRTPLVLSTGVRWTPARSGTLGDYSPTSLGELARSKPRNDLILRTYADNHHEFGKTLVFACDIDHAEKLAKRFIERGFVAEALHSNLPPELRREILGRFRTRSSDQRSSIEVLVNVAMLTHGVDIPDIQTIFLARPTTSAILFAQMIGRGARRTPEKDTFNIVDFVDNLQVHGDVLQTAAAFVQGFGESEPPAPSQPAPTLTRPRGMLHSHTPSSMTIYPGKPGYEALGGLELNPAQTFGVEMELTRADFNGTQPVDWGWVAATLLGAVREVVVADLVAPASLPEAKHPDKSHDVWNVEWDMTCGWEVTSRVLSGESGFEEVYDVARALEKAAKSLGLVVSTRTGAHVHLAWRPADGNWDHIRRLLLAVAYYEPAFNSLVSPSRVDNDYCQSVCRHWPTIRRLSTFPAWQAFLDSEAAQYLSVDVSHLRVGDFGTVEVRLHNGTIDGAKLLRWMSLWMRLLSAIDRNAPLHETEPDPRLLPLTDRPQGDIVHLCKALSIGQKLTGDLATRRADVIEKSWLASEQYGDLARRVSATWAGPVKKAS